MTAEEIKRIAASSRRYNFHSHTQFCDGRAPMAEMATAAFKVGMEHYAFTPHCPTAVASPCNMDYGKVAEFLVECQRLKEEYSGRMEIYSGMEIDYLSPQCGPAAEYYRSLPLDVRIGSVHFVPNQRGEYIDCDGSYERFARNLAERFRGDIRYVVEKYFEQVTTMISLGGFDLLGHFDKIASNAAKASPGLEETGWYGNIIAHLFDQIEASGLAVEVNTKAYGRDGRMFPDIRWWPEMKRRGIAPIVNSDAHYPDLIEAGRREAFGMLDSISL